VKGSDVTITGFDEPTGAPWTVKGKVTDDGMSIDFTPKGGPAGVPAKWTGKSFTFPDGNEWSKLSGRSIVASSKFIGGFYDKNLGASQYSIGVVQGGQISLKASDGLGPEKKWEGKGSVIGDDIYLDMSAKGEKGIVVGKKTSKGIEFENGMLWSFQGL
jgi:hypothetical protein